MSKDSQESVSDTTAFADIKATLARDENGFAERAYVTFNGVMRYEELTFFRKYPSGGMSARLIPYLGKRGTINLPEALSTATGTIVFPTAFGRKVSYSKHYSFRKVWAIVDGNPMKGEYYIYQREWECMANLRDAAWSDMPQQLRIGG